MMSLNTWIAGLALAAPMWNAVAQGVPERPTVAVVMTLDATTRPDSATLIAAMRRGVQADSLVILLERPVRVVDEQTRNAHYFVTATFLSVGTQVRVAIRTVETEHGVEFARAARTTTRDDLVKTLEELARNAARQLAAPRAPAP